MKHFILPQYITTYIISNTTCHQFKKDKKKLEWQRFVNKEKLNWEKSKTFANQLKLNGSNWNLPDLNELKGLVNKNYNYYKHMDRRMSLNFICFGFCVYIDFWSASPMVDYYYYAWYVNFNDGNSNYNYVSNFDSVRCVR